MFEPTFGWGGAISLSLMGSLEIFQKKKKKFKKKELFKFLSFGLKLEKLWFFPFRTMASRNVWANVRIGRGHFPLFDGSFGDLSKKKKVKKKKTFQISLFWIQIGETLVLSFSYNGSQKCLSQRSDWEGPFSSLWWVHWRSFKKKKREH